MADYMMYTGRRRYSRQRTKVESNETKEVYKHCQLQLAGQKKERKRAQIAGKSKLSQCQVTLSVKYQCIS
jgi:beta-lactamase regulating signal transducer with metallopeptidase domain